MPKGIFPTRYGRTAYLQFHRTSTRSLFTFNHTYSLILQLCVFCYFQASQDVIGIFMPSPHIALLVFPPPFLRHHPSGVMWISASLLNLLHIIATIHLLLLLAIINSTYTRLLKIELSTLLLISRLIRIVTRRKYPYIEHYFSYILSKQVDCFLH